MKLGESVNRISMLYFVMAGIVWTFFGIASVLGNVYVKVSGKKHVPKHPVSTYEYTNIPLEMRRDPAFKRLTNDRKESMNMYVNMWGLESNKDFPKLPGEDLSKEELSLAQKYMNTPYFPQFDTYAISNGSFLLVPWDRTQGPDFENDPMLP